MKKSKILSPFRSLEGFSLLFLALTILITMAAGCAKKNRTGVKEAPNTPNTQQSVSQNQNDPGQTGISHFEFVEEPIVLRWDVPVNEDQSFQVQVCSQDESMCGDYLDIQCVGAFCDVWELGQYRSNVYMDIIVNENQTRSYLLEDYQYSGLGENLILRMKTTQGFGNGQWVRGTKVNQ